MKSTGADYLNLDTEGSVDTEEEIIINNKEIRNLKLVKTLSKIVKRKKTEDLLSFIYGLQTWSDQKKE